MTGLAIVEPTTLLGEAVRALLGSQSDQWARIELFTADPEEVGAVTEVAGRAAIVQSAQDGEALEGFSVALLCGSGDDSESLAALPQGCRCIFLDSTDSNEGTAPSVSGIGGRDLTAASRVFSPEPAVILLSHVLAPVLPLGRLEVTAHVLQPASARGRAGLDELFEQTRNIITMQDQGHQEVFGTQLAFNILPWTTSSPAVSAHLESVLGSGLVARIHLSQAGVFHCCSAAIHLQLETDPGADQLQDLLLDSPMLERTANPELLGPVATSTSQKILIGDLASPVGKGYWIWSCADNLFLAADNGLKLATA